jgi:hypothetical protein
MRLFSAFGAADALERDRQTIKRALRGIPPDGHEGKQPRWRLKTILNAVDRHTGRNAAPSANELPPHVAALCTRLDGLLTKMLETKSVAEARKIMRSEYFSMLAETTRAMYAIADSDRTIYVMEHERLNLAVCRKPCGWSFDEILAEYDKACGGDEE